MKKYTTILLVIIIAASGCGRTSSKKKCESFDSFDVAQEGDQITFSWSEAEEVNYYEISYGLASSNNDPSSGEVITTNAESSETQLIPDLLLEEEMTYNFYIRAKCSEDEDLFSDWEGPIVLTIEAFCEMPKNLNTTSTTEGIAFQWNYSLNNSQYQVQYGLQGFELGSGDTINAYYDLSTNKMVMEEGNTYDFYVRSSCRNNLGWSGWAGPVSYYADRDQNLCKSPSDIVVTIIRNPSGEAVGAKFDWNGHYNFSFEHMVVFDYQNVGDGNPDISTSPTCIYEIEKDKRYVFYIRTACVDNTHTLWRSISFNSF